MQKELEGKGGKGEEEKKRLQKSQKKSPQVKKPHKSFGNWAPKKRKNLGEREK